MPPLHCARTIAITIASHSIYSLVFSTAPLQCFALIRYSGMQSLPAGSCEAVTVTVTQSKAHLVWNHDWQACVCPQDGAHRVHTLYVAGHEFGSVAVCNVDALPHDKRPRQELQGGWVLGVAVLGSNSF